MQIRVNSSRKHLKIAIAGLLLLVIVIGVLIWRASAENGSSGADAVTETSTTGNSESPVPSEVPDSVPGPPLPPDEARKAAPPEEMPQPTQQEVDSRRAERSKCKLSGGEWSSGYGVGGMPDGEVGCRH